MNCWRKCRPPSSGRHKEVLYTVSTMFGCALTGMAKRFARISVVLLLRNKLGKYWIVILSLAIVNIFLLSYNLKWISYGREDGTLLHQNQIYQQGHTNNHIYKWKLANRKLNGTKLAEVVKSHCSSNIQTYKRGGKGLEAFLIHQMHYVIHGSNQLYCPVEKVASTFWRRFIYQVNHKESVQHPYQVSISQALGQQFSHPNVNTTEGFADHFKFLFVRDPYHRILSAYIDKLFVPNPTYWKRYGVHAIKLFRSDDDRKCFHDATFSEFVQFVVWSITNHKHIDPHFLPASEMCLPCSMNYTYIGKMETFADDAIPIFEYFGLYNTVPFLKKDLKEYSDIDAIEDSIFSPFSWRDEIVTCMGWYEAQLRIWRKLQMRGLIDMDHKFPLNIHEAQKVTREHFLELAYGARLNSDPVKLRQQKKDVFIELYRSVPISVIQKLRDLLNSDLYLFDYEPRPKEIFDRTLKYSEQNFFNFKI